MIKVDIQEKSFGGKVVLKAVRFSIDRSEVVAIQGPSGVGKSSVLRIVAGIDKAFTGTVTQVGSVAVVFQDPTLLAWRSVIDNLRLTTHKPDAQILELLNEVGVADKKDQFPNQLSLGQNRRVALVRALAVEPDLLILDEPFTSLDEALADDMLKLTKRLIAKRGVPTLFVTHSNAEAEALAHRTLHLAGSPAGLR